VVHYAGICAEMDAISRVAERHGLIVIEDAAQALLSTYRGRPAGRLGELACFSFHETKNFTCGEGGALIVNDPDLVERALIIRDKGTNRSRFYRGQVDKYTWVDLGSSYLLSDFLAAFLCAQLEARELIQTKRLRVWNYYYGQLDDWARSGEVQLPVIPADCEHSSHMFYMLMPSREDRDSLIAHLKENDILSVFHYVPLHLSDAGKMFMARQNDCHVAEGVSERLLRLPFYNDLTDNDLSVVVDAVTQFSVGRACRN